MEQVLDVSFSPIAVRVADHVFVAFGGLANAQLAVGPSQGRTWTKNSVPLFASWGMRAREQGLSRRPHLHTLRVVLNAL